MADPLTLSHEIDTLLEQYLTLLNTYTTLRTQLSSTQSSIQQNLARANFTAERGVRYGSDCYDSRMRASRLVTIAAQNEFGVGEAEGKELAEGTPSNIEGRGGEDGEKDAEASENKEKEKRKDPIRMFGILTPQALKAAQAEAIKLVEEIVPKLVRVDREMLVLEIEVRRRRKWLAKAEGIEKERQQQKESSAAGVQCRG